MKKIATLIAFFGFLTMALAQTGTITGKVVSEQNIPLTDVSIKIKGNSKGTMTNSQGVFTIPGLAPNNYTLQISYIGFGSQNVKAQVSANQTTTVPLIVLVEQQQELSEVTVEGHQNKYAVKEPSTSLRLKTEIAKLPQNIQVIGGELLKDQQVTSIMDGVIRNVSGVTMLEHWGNFARVNMRGFRLPAFRNGFNVQDTWGPLSEDMAFVDRIEFVKGPAGFMMAAGEPGGFYNVVTKKPTANRVRNISFMVGSYDTYRAAIDLGGKLTKDGKLLYRLNGLYQTADTHRGNEDAVRYGVAPAITYNISDNTSITTELTLQEAESYIGSAYVFAPVSYGYGSLDRDFKMTDNNYPASDIEELTLFTTLSHKISDNWSFESKFGYLRYDQTGNSTWLWSMAENGDAVRYISAWDALSIGKYFQTYIFGDFKTGGISHNVLGGFDYSQKQYWSDFNQSAIIDVNQPFNIYNPVYGNTVAPEFDRSVSIRDRGNGALGYSYGSTNRSFYAQDEIGFIEDKVRLTVAGRYTYLTTIGKAEADEVVTPRFGLSADILPSFKVYALYDESFLTQSGISASLEPLNDPVNAKDIEGGLKKTFFNGRLKTSLGVFKINKDKILVTDPENPNYSIYSGEIESKGIEFDMSGEITPELNIILNYANTNVEDKSGSLVAGFAKHVTNGWLNYNFAPTSSLKGFGASLGYQYQVDRSTWAWAADNQSDLPNYFRLDGALSWKNDKFRVQLNVNNILDEYLYAGANYGTYLYWQSEPGINGRVTVSYSF